MEPLTPALLIVPMVAMFASMPPPKTAQSALTTSLSASICNQGEYHAKKPAPQATTALMGCARLVTKNASNVTYRAPTAQPAA